VKKILLFVVPLLFCLSVLNSSNAQVYNYEDGEGPVPPDSISGIYIGINIGSYWANNNTAFIYDGRGYARDGDFYDPFLQFNQTWLNQAIQGSVQAEQRMDRLMNPDAWEFTPSDMPLNMNFGASFMWAGHIRYMFNSDFGVFTEIGGAFPVAIGEFTIERVGGFNQPGDQVRRFGIRGEEQRFFVNLGLHRVLGRKRLEKQGKTSSILPYIDLGGSVTFTRFDANFINLDEEGTADLTVFFNQQGQFTDQANLLTGSGFGGFGGAGIQITIGSKFTIDLGYIGTLTSISMGEVSETGFQHQIVLKAIYM